MSDKFLSQDEIDALLKMNQDVNEEPEKIDDIARDVLGEVGNISMSNSATALSTLLNRKVNITTPKVELVSIKHLTENFDMPYVLLLIKFDEGFIGSNALLMDVKDASIIASILMGGDGSNPNTELSEIELSAVSEVMNQMIGSASTALATMFNKRVNISPPIVKIIGQDADLQIAGMDMDDVVKISFRMTVDDLIDSEIMQLYSMETAEQIISQMMGETAQEVEEKETPKPKLVEKEVEYEEEESVVEIKKPKFNSLTEKETVRGKSNIDMIMDVPLELSVILGRSRRSIKDILSFEPGAIIELNEVVEEPLDVYVNGKLIAKGEVVVIDEKFGIRITNILSAKERVKKLR
ncbi:MAG: flagellar motor switch phosphatase FliY [Clostridiales bacterium]|nr:flagellar motor switch phosphatase FliY [Clostridiales bacterium]